MSLDLDLFRLRVFTVVVERGGHSAAARELHLAQSTVSRHVAELERSCGAPLLDHDGRTLRLTEPGRSVYQAAVTMLSEQGNLETTLADLAHGRGGRVRLGATMALERRGFLDEVVAPFLRDHEELRLSLRFGHSRELAWAVLERRLDLAYVLRSDLPEGAPFEPLQRAELAFLVATGHPLARAERVTVEEVERAGLISAPAVSAQSQFFRQLLRRRGIEHGGVRLELDGQQARLLAAEAGLGVLATFVPTVGGDRLGATLRRIRVDVPTTTIELGLVGQPEATSTRHTRALAARIRDAAR